MPSTTKDMAELPLETKVVVILNDYLPKDFIGTMSYWNMIEDVQAVLKQNQSK